MKTCKLLGKLYPYNVNKNTTSILTFIFSIYRFFFFCFVRYFQSVCFTFITLNAYQTGYLSIQHINTKLVLLSDAIR